MYWFRKANENLKPGQRAGLVGTNSIMQNRGREASLDYIVRNGGVITDAVSTQKWPGEAKVHVSIVNWVKNPAVAPSEFELDGEKVDGITSSLTIGTGDEWAPLALPQNRDRAFQGPVVVGAGFILDEDEALGLVAADPGNRDVVRPYLVGDDIAARPEQDPSRWVIDFAQRGLETASKFPQVLSIVRDRVKPFRDFARRDAYRTKWWQFGEARVGMRAALEGMPRYASVGRVGKRMLLAWQDAWTCPSDLVIVFSFDDDYSMGVLMSAAHEAWARARSSTLETRLRYTPSSVFETFPWPDPTTAQRRAIAESSVDLYSRRSELCVEYGMGLTKLYNLMDEGGFAELAALHKRLDEAVAEAYGWPKGDAQDAARIVAHLTELNRRIAQGEVDYHPFDG
ncbi:hypothetical protein GCM10009573_01450 [Agromyces bracchium]